MNSVSWAPAVAPGQVVSASGNQAGAARRFVTGGSDCQVKLWEFSAETGSWQNTQILPGHTDWVRDVAWSPTVLSKSYIASASQDRTVRIWTSSDLRKSNSQAFRYVLNTGQMTGNPLSLMSKPSPGASAGV